MDDRDRDIHGDRLTSPGEEQRQYLVFMEGPYTLALEIEGIKRVYDAESGFPPRTAGSRMLDLVELTGIDSSVSHDYWIEMETESGRYLMPVQAIEGIGDFNLAVRLEYPEILRRDSTGYIKRLYFDGMKMMVELDRDGLIQMYGAAGARGRRRRKKRGAAKPAGGGDSSGAFKTGDLGAEQGRRIIFETGGEIWGLDLEYVVQVVNKDEIFPVPSLERNVVGVIYYNDMAAPVMAPEQMLEVLLERKPEVGAYSMIIITETSKGLLGLACERIVEVAHELGAADKDGADNGSAPSGPGSGKEPRIIELDKLVSEISEGS